MDKWSFDVFVLHEASGEHALKFLVYELLNRYDLIKPLLGQMFKNILINQTWVEIFEKAVQIL